MLAELLIINSGEKVFFTIGDLADTNPEKSSFLAWENGSSSMAVCKRTRYFSRIEYRRKIHDKNGGQQHDCSTRSYFQRGYKDHSYGVKRKRFRKTLGVRFYLCRTVQIGIRDNELNWIERQGKLEILNRTAKSIF